MVVLGLLHLASVFCESRIKRMPQGTKEKTNIGQEAHCGEEGQKRVPHWLSKINGTIDYVEIGIPNVDPAPGVERAEVAPASTK